MLEVDLRLLARIGSRGPLQRLEQLAIRSREDAHTRVGGGGRRAGPVVEEADGLCVRRDVGGVALRIGEGERLLGGSREERCPARRPNGRPATPSMPAHSASTPLELALEELRERRAAGQSGGRTYTSSRLPEGSAKKTA